MLQTPTPIENRKLYLHLTDPVPVVSTLACSYNVYLSKLCILNTLDIQKKDSSQIYGCY